jgi:hypothetical protein
MMRSAAPALSTSKETLHFWYRHSMHCFCPAGCYCKYCVVCYDELMILLRARFSRMLLSALVLINQLCICNLFLSLSLFLSLYISAGYVGWKQLLEEILNMNRAGGTKVRKELVMKEGG